MLYDIEKCIHDAEEAHRLEDRIRIMSQEPIIYQRIDAMKSVIKAWLKH